MTTQPVSNPYTLGRASATEHAWSSPFYGVQCYPADTEYSTREYWADVVDRETYAECSVWTPGCGFSPITTEHENVEAAKAHAEAKLFELTRGAMGAKTTGTQP